MANLYKSIIFSRNNTAVPLFQSGNPAHSKYNPQQEAVLFAEQIQEADLFLIIGLAAGYHIKALAEKFPKSKILVIENSKEDIIFLKKNIPCVSMLIKNERISVFPVCLTEQEILNEYLPAAYPKFSILELRSWTNENSSMIPFLKERIKSTIEIVKADFATQSRFGKLWQHNILKNIRYHDSDVKLPLDGSKKAIITAAGPSLDENIPYILKERQNIYLISTDTAYSVLKKYKIACDAVISIDGQFISHNHFFAAPDSRTLFVFDICANPASVRKIIEYGNKTIFSTNGHPLPFLIEKINGGGTFLKLNTGSGTVTIAAIDFARKAGFNEIQVIGADFGYIKGKTYAKGTYLDNLYLEGQMKTNSFEKKFSELMYRFELQETQGKKKTTRLLDSYRMSFEKWIAENDFSATKNTDIYCLHGNNNAEEKCTIELSGINMKNLSEELNRLVKLSGSSKKDEFVPETVKTGISDIFINAFLPYIAYLRGRKRFSDKTFQELQKLALDDFVQYTL